MQLIRETHFDFMSKRKAAFIFSLLIIVPGLISMLVRGGLNLGVEFAGGMQIEFGVRGDAPVDIVAVRQAVADAGYDNRNIQRAGGSSGAHDAVYLVHLLSQAEGGTVTGEEAAGRETAAQKILQKLRERYPGDTIELRGVESIGPKIGSELKGAAIKAALLSILLVMAYVAWRFEFRFGVATIFAAAHDVLFVLGLFSILNKEMTLSVLAAFLTLVGYSVNDTIVVFDRIREELKLKQKRESYEAIFNGGINKTLGRTLLTGVTTLLVLLAIYFYGGDVLRDFAWVLLIGILVGTYSSIFVAAPLVVEMHKRSEARDAARAAGTTARVTS
jgi:preprotein translocase subunit SecF